MFDVPKVYQHQDLGFLVGIDPEINDFKQAITDNKNIVLISDATGSGKTTIASSLSGTHLPNYGIVPPLFIPFLRIPSPYSYDPSDKQWWSDFETKLVSSVPYRIIIDNVQIEHGKHAVDIHQNFRYLFHMVYDYGKKYVITTTMEESSIPVTFRPDIASRLNEAVWIHLPGKDFRGV